ncbi:hypothetical protein [Paenisporosarcina cavernae]|uniref:Uncharacterized protein n=1 Tax=Paenisporosarcina cavernae TaxID=2320858 RepID=A0A385YVV0_9BACL|nr:hypothetical protein [Paenisporosarcina cavernae]AYC30664.1 hypothetical protein D3873_12835 [Paenisporosarcina cavernae]
MIKTHWRDIVIEHVVQGIYDTYPELLERYGETGRIRCEEDNHHHLDHLESAATIQDEQVFLHYTEWLSSLLTARGMKNEHIIDNFERLKHGFKLVDFAEKEAFIMLLDKGIARLQN